MSETTSKCEKCDWDANAEAGPDLPLYIRKPSGQQITHCPECKTVLREDDVSGLDQLGARF